MKLFGTSLLMILAMLAITSCESEEPDPNLNYFGYGTSFGECLGYCKNEMTIYQDMAFYKMNGWDQSGELPEVQCSQPVRFQEFLTLMDSVQVGSFFELDSIIGCPDCADGGAEWVQISFGDEVHRVTFEYMNEPEQLAALIPLLREQMTGFKDCGQ